MEADEREQDDINAQVRALSALSPDFKAKLDVVTGYLPTIDTKLDERLEQGKKQRRRTGLSLAIGAAILTALMVIAFFGYRILTRIEEGQKTNDSALTLSRRNDCIRGTNADFNIAQAYYLLDFAFAFTVDPTDAQAVKTFKSTLQQDVLKVQTASEAYRNAGPACDKLLANEDKEKRNAK